MWILQCVFDCCILLWQRLSRKGDNPWRALVELERYLADKWNDQRSLQHMYNNLPFHFCSRILMLTDRSVLTTAAVHQICVTTIRQICQRACLRWPARSSRCWGWRRTQRERWGLWSARRDMLREEQPVTSLLTLRKEDWWKGKVVAQKAISFKFVHQLNFLK